METYSVTISALLGAALVGVALAAHAETPTPPEPLP